MRPLPPACSPLRTALEIMAEGPHALWAVRGAFAPKFAHPWHDGSDVLIAPLRTTRALADWCSPTGDTDASGRVIYKLDADTAARVRAAA